MENNLLGDELEIKTVKKQIFQGVSALLIREFFLKVFSFVGQIILARILFPSDFGTIAIIAFIINFFSLFIDIGLSPAIIREKKKPSQKQLSTIFVLKLLLSLICILCIFITAPFIASFINGFDTENVIMIWIYGLTLIFTSFKAVPIALVERELKFDVVSKIDIAGVVAYQISVVIFAVLGLRIWSFIIAIFVKEIFECVVIYKYCPWRPSFYFNRKKIKNMIHFGAYMQGGGIINFFQVSIIPILGGLKTNPYQVGLLDWAFSNALISETITNNFGRVVFSGFGKIQHNRKLISDIIYKSIKFLSIITVFFFILVLGFGKEIVELIYTPKWLPGVYALYWFSAAMIFTPFILIYAQGVFALGKSKTYFKFNFLCVVIEYITGLILLMKFGFLGIAISFFILCFTLALSSYYIARTEKITEGIFKLITMIVSLLIISITTSILLNELINYSILGLIVKILLQSAIFIILVSIFARDFVSFLINTLRGYYFNIRK